MNEVNNIFSQYRHSYRDSRFPIPDSRFPIPDCRLPAPYSLKPTLWSGAKGSDRSMIKTVWILVGRFCKNPKIYLNLIQE